MSQSVNKVILIGNIGQKPSIKTVQNDKKMITFSLATNETWKDKNTGERKQRAEWHKIVVVAEHLIEISQSLKKGHHIFLEGKRQTRTYHDKNNNEQLISEIVLNAFMHKIEKIEPWKGQSDQTPDGDYSDYLL